MKFLAGNSSSFEKCIDRTISPAESIVGRYCHAVQFDAQPEYDRELKNCLKKTSIREGARIINFMRYKEVDIHILDETSMMATGTLKSIDGCLTSAFCRMEGVKRIVFESGGNTGSALTRYGNEAGLETFFFCPLDNIDLLDSRLFLHPGAHLIGVEDRGRVKELTRLFADRTGIRHVPERSWRNASSMFRGLFILEHLLSVRKVDWLVQAVSAGFGPIGIYAVLENFRSELNGRPRFLGIQQEANCPMFAACKPEEAMRLERTSIKKKRLLTRVMYDEQPQTYKTFEDLRRLLLLTGGDLLTINEEEFAAGLHPSAETRTVLELLKSLDIPISLRSGDVLEKTGLIGLTGTLKAIDNGLIDPGSTVLCCLTSGVSKADGAALPQAIVRDQRDIFKFIKKLPEIT